MRLDQLWNQGLGYSWRLILGEAAELSFLNFSSSVKAQLELFRKASAGKGRGKVGLCLGEVGEELEGVIPAGLTSAG